MRYTMLPYKRYRGFFLAEGIMFILLGVLAILLPQISTLATEFFIGTLLLIGGVFQFIRVLTSRDIPEYWLMLLTALVSAVVGYLLIANPMKGLLTLTILLSIYFFLDGVLKIGLGIGYRKVLPASDWVIVSGVLSLILGGIIVSGWPGTATWVIGLLVGINLLFLGFSMVTLSTIVDE